MAQKQKQKKESDDWITIVPEKSVVDDPISDWFGWEKAIQFKRAVPYRSQPIEAFFEGKVRKKDLVQVHLRIPTGITLQYQGRQWAENTSLKILMPFDMAEKIAQDIIKTVKRYRKHAPLNAKKLTPEASTV